MAAIAPECSASLLDDLELTILEYRSDYEKSSEGRSAQGFASLQPLGPGSPETCGVRQLNAVIKNWERKFHEPYSPPSDPEAVWVGSPISAEQATKMTDEQWLRAIAKHDHRRVDPTDISKGGPRELARELAAHVRAEPGRFAELILRTPAETNPHYIAEVLRGLKESDESIGIDTVLKVCHKAFAKHLESAGGEIADLLGVTTGDLPDDAVAMLASLATEHPHPPERSWRDTWDSGVEDTRGRDLLTAGINTTRGKAILAIAQLIGRRWQLRGSFAGCRRTSRPRLQSSGSRSGRCSYLQLDGG